MKIAIVERSNHEISIEKREEAFVHVSFARDRVRAMPSPSYETDTEDGIAVDIPSRHDFSPKPLISPLLMRPYARAFRDNRLLLLGDVARF